MYEAARGSRGPLAIRAVVLAAGVLTQPAYAQPAAAPLPHPVSSSANHYVEPALCARCHPEIANNFRKTGMGRSLYRLSPATAIEDFTPGEPFYHQASDCYFAMIERDGKYYQRRWQKGVDGRETNVEESQVDFVLGSGKPVEEQGENGKRRLTGGKGDCST